MITLSGKTCKYFAGTGSVTPFSLLKTDRLRTFSEKMKLSMWLFTLFINTVSSKSNQEDCSPKSCLLMYSVSS